MTGGMLTALGFIATVAALVGLLLPRILRQLGREDAAADQFRRSFPQQERRWGGCDGRTYQTEAVFLPAIGALAFFGCMIWIAYALAGGLGVLLLILL